MGFSFIVLGNKNQLGRKPQCFEKVKIKAINRTNIQPKARNGLQVLHNLNPF